LSLSYARKPLGIKQVTGEVGPYYTISGQTTGQNLSVISCGNGVKTIKLLSNISNLEGLCKILM